MKKFCLILAALFVCICSRAQEKGPYSGYLDRVDSFPFLVIDKPAFTLTIVDSLGFEIKHYGVALAARYGKKTKNGDGKTPEGAFRINQLLNSRGLSHDFCDGKGPVAGAYGPWFLRLDVPGTRQIGIHGTHKPESIGTRDTEGCIRLRNEDIIDLKQRVSVGTWVFITPDLIQ